MKIVSWLLSKFKFVPAHTECQEILEKAGRLVRIDEVTSREYTFSIQNVTPSTAPRKLVNSGSSYASHAHGIEFILWPRRTCPSGKLVGRPAFACLCLRFPQKQAASTASPSGPLWPLGQEFRHSCTSGLNRHAYSAGGELRSFRDTGSAWTKCLVNRPGLVTHARTALTPPEAPSGGGSLSSDHDCLARGVGQNLRIHFLEPSLGSQRPGEGRQCEALQKQLRLPRAVCTISWHLRFELVPLIFRIVLLMA